MSIDKTVEAPPAPARNAYGRVIRERGTVKLLLVAAVVGIVWVAYNRIHTNMLHQAKWPPLTADMQGLTVIGLRDKDRPGWRHKYEAIERGHAWIFRRPEDQEGGDDSDSESTDNTDRGTNPGATHRVAQGEIVDIQHIMADKAFPVVLTGNQFTSASVEERTEELLDRHYYVVTVNLNDEGRSRYWQYSIDRPGERIVFVLQGQALTCPQIPKREGGVMDALLPQLDVGSLEIQPIWDKADADRLANFINGRRK